MFLFILFTSLLDLISDFDDLSREQPPAFEARIFVQDTFLELKNPAVAAILVVHIMAGDLPKSIPGLDNVIGNDVLCWRCRWRGHVVVSQKAGSGSGRDAAYDDCFFQHFSHLLFVPCQHQPQHDGRNDVSENFVNRHGRPPSSDGSDCIALS
nr:MAG TPA: hypothetical protein [Caudoviricetes sp.]